MSSSKNTLNTSPNKMGRLVKMTVFNILMIVMTSVCDFPIILWRQSDGPFFSSPFLDLPNAKK
jgi:hypothetical protein